MNARENMLKDMAGQFDKLSNLLKSAAQIDPEEFGRRFPPEPMEVNVDFSTTRDGKKTDLSLSDLGIGQIRTAMTELDLKQQLLLKHLEELTTQFILKEMQDTDFFSDGST